MDKSKERQQDNQGHGQSLVRIHIDRHPYESPTPTTGSALYALGKIPPHHELYREAQGDGNVEDELIEDGPEKVHLTQDEHFYSEERHPQKIRVTACLLPSLTNTQKFGMHPSDPLVEILRRWASRSSQTLLPDGDTPLDRLHSIAKHDEVSPTISDLQQPLGEFLTAPHATRHFGVELVRAFRVNTRWWVAPKEKMTPHEILDLAGLKHEDYSLYRDQSAVLLPLDVPIDVNRGDVFEAQRDGKYGGDRL